MNGTFEITGGTLMAAGSSEMMVAPSTDSDQGWLATALAGTATAGSEVVITDADDTSTTVTAGEAPAGGDRGMPSAG